MGFSRILYTPGDGLKNKEAFKTTPVSEDAAREQFQRLFDQVKVQVNALMAALESVGNQNQPSGARQIGSAPIGLLSYEGAAAETVWTQLAAMNEKVNEAISGGLSISEIIGDGDVVSSMLDDGAVTADKLADGSVSGSKLQAMAVDADKLGEVGQLTLKRRTELGPDAADMLTYENGALTLRIEGCAPVQLAPVVFGTAAAPPSGTYPAGTVYVQYVV